MAVHGRIPAVHGRPLPSITAHRRPSLRTAVHRRPSPPIAHPSAAKPPRPNVAASRRQLRQLLIDGASLTPPHATRDAARLAPVPRSSRGFPRSCGALELAGGLRSPQLGRVSERTGRLCVARLGAVARRNGLRCHGATQEPRPGLGTIALCCHGAAREPRSGLKESAPPPSSSKPRVSWAHALVTASCPAPVVESNRLPMLPARAHPGAESPASPRALRATIVPRHGAAMQRPQGFAVCIPALPRPQTRGEWGTLAVGLSSRLRLAAPVLVNADCFLIRSGQLRRHGLALPGGCGGWANRVPAGAQWRIKACRKRAVAVQGQTEFCRREFM